MHYKCSTSRSRRSRRLLLGVNRKLAAFRWMGETTVGVVRNSVWTSYPPQLKAEQGVEKSCDDSRMLKDQRRPCAPARQARVQAKSAPETRTSWYIKKQCSTADYWYARVEQFDQLLRRSQMVRRSMGEVDPQGEQKLSYSVWLGRWRALSRRVREFGEDTVWCSRIGPSFSYHLEQRFGILVRGAPAAPRTLAELVSTGPLPIYRIGSVGKLDYPPGRNGRRSHPFLGDTRVIGMCACRRSHVWCPECGGCVYRICSCSTCADISASRPLRRSRGRGAYLSRR